MANWLIREKWDYVLKRKMSEQVQPQTLIFEGMVGAFVWHGISFGRYEVLQYQFQERGGKVQHDITDETTHIFTSAWVFVLDKYWLCRCCPLCIQSTAKCVNFDMLCALLMIGTCVPEKDFRLDLKGFLVDQLKNWQDKHEVFDKWGGWKSHETIKEEEKAKLRGGNKGKEEENQAPMDSDTTKSDGETSAVQCHQHKCIAHRTLVDSNATTINRYIRDFE